LVINENLRVQRGGADPVPYIDVANVLSDVAARQNHAIFGRRGCGKSLLLHYSAKILPPEIKSVYLNCEDFKKHSFPNVLIEILDALFGELEKNLTGWFGRKKKSRGLISDIRQQLATMRQDQDTKETEIRQTDAVENKEEQKSGFGVELKSANLSLSNSLSQSDKREIEQRYKLSEDKIRALDTWLPRLKQQIREFFELSGSVKAVFLQIDDLYHLGRADQPLVIDYIHRLCKDLPLYFKLATLRHASTLYADRKGQPIGAQERHDYQPINIDFSLADFARTVEQNRSILREFGTLANIKAAEIDDLFKGAGFERLTLAGGGVPRDCLSLFLEVLQSVQPPSGDGRIGKDDVRILSRANFERRIEELKYDSEGAEQGTLIKGIYLIRQFCIERQTNLILVSEAVLQQNDTIRALLYRLLDYRIIHTAGLAITHKSQPGTYHAMAIDIGCYAHMRVLSGRFTEIDLSDLDAKEKMRSAPILDERSFSALWDKAPRDVNAAIIAQYSAEPAPTQATQPASAGPRPR
jgi:energy-coupling factor transporter ATP-binding protein EcfA2